MANLCDYDNNAVVSDVDSDSSPDQDQALRSDSSEDYVPGCFEGPEKNLEVLFKSDVGHPSGCRNLQREALDKICASAKCTIMSKISNSHFDAYVLSESSLFVYPHKIILKTCGRTTLLRCLEPLLKLASEIGLELEWLIYSRKNYSFPDEQFFPHSSFHEEFAYLKKHPELETRLAGSGYILGPITGDHFLAYVSDKEEPGAVAHTERTVNIMMFDLDPTVAEQFYTVNSPTAKEMTTKSGIANLVPGAVIDDREFEPCGYSMNAMLYGSYSTVHITPEPECSYASFETNTQLTSYDSLISNVLAVFRPGRVVITMIADEAGMAQVKPSPYEKTVIIVPKLGRYVRSTSSFSKVEGDCCVSMGNWELKGANASPSNSAVPIRRQRSGSV